MTETDVALVDRLWLELGDHRWEEVIALSGQLAARLNCESDREMARWLGKAVLATADRLAWIGGTAWRVTRLVVSLNAQASLDRGIALTQPWALRPGRSIRTRPPRTRSIDAKSRHDRMKQALSLYDCLIASFGGELDPGARRLVARAQIARIVPLIAGGRYRSVVRGVRLILAIQPALLVAAIDLAESDAHGCYTRADRAVAILPITFSLMNPLV
jgi:hypothetical protein